MTIPRRDVAVTLRAVRLDHPAVGSLLDGLGKEFARRYGDEPFPRVVEEFLPPGGFFTAWLGERAVGCAGFRPLKDGVAELKRLYVVPDLRGRRIAGRLLAAVEEQAARLGWRELWLETGVRQPEAIALYERSGYARIPDFGEYAGQPLSVCYGKPLT
jgi:putative acetyltransferase